MVVCANSTEPDYERTLPGGLGQEGGAQGGRISLVPLGFSLHMRTIWNGSINPGLVNIPIGLAVAQQRKDVSFRTLHRECGRRSSESGGAVHERDVEPTSSSRAGSSPRASSSSWRRSDLEAVALTLRSRSTSRASRSTTSTRSTSTAPTTSRRARARPSAGRTCSCCARCRRRTSRRSASSCSGQGEPLPHPPARRRARAGGPLLRRGHPLARGDRPGGGETEVADPELDMARQLVASMVGEFDPEDYANEYRGELRAMLDAKLEGKEISCPSRPARAGHRPHGGAQGKRLTGAEGQVRGHEGQEGACAQEARGVRFPLPLVRGRRRGPGRQVRWKRVLSILPW